MNKKLYTLLCTIIGCIGTVASAIVTYLQPAFATAIVAAIGIGTTAIIDILGLFVNKS